MYKSLAVAALVGAASAAQSATLFSYDFMNSDNTMSYYNFKLGYKYDVGYQTLYNPQGPHAPAQDSTETYAFNIFAYVDLTFEHEIMDSYEAMYDFKFDAINFTPYAQTVTWSRFDNGAGFSVSTSAYRDLELLTWGTRVRENAKTAHYSAFGSDMPW
jgi:hypothetical protein